MNNKNILGVLFCTLLFSACENKSEKMETELKAFIEHYDSIIKPLSKSMALAYWDASISGKDEDFKKAEVLDKEYVKLHSSKADFEKLKELKDSKAIKDSLLLRQLDVLYFSYLSNQADTALLKEIIEMESEIEKKYNNFRADCNGKQLTDNELENILTNSKNNSELQKIWEAHKKIGPLVAIDIIKLVKKRNEQAKQLGFNNYHEMSLKLNEQEPVEVEKIFDELDALTEPTFTKIKDDIDTYLAKRDNIDKQQLMPWHYQNRYFQEAPKIYPIDLDKYYKGKNLEELTNQYYKSINLPIDEILKNSDLYEKPGKSQHAFCSDIDNEGDVRVLCNIQSNSYWMNTMLHEFGHAIYDKYIDIKLPFTLRSPAHILTTEAVAMMFGRLSSNPQWIQDICKIDDKEKELIAENCHKTLRLEQLVFSRWAQVMYRFEKGMYENPDQDLNTLWWQLVEKYQKIKKPEGRNEPDWATKIHIATAPCYYHNYLLGELFASQIHYYICKDIIKDTTHINMTSYYSRPEVGEYLRQNIFIPGAKYFWNDMIEKATGEKLTAKYYAKQFVE